MGGDELELEPVDSWLRRLERRTRGDLVWRRFYMFQDAAVERLSRKGEPLGPGKTTGTSAIVLALKV
jgi:hypothetical protein